MIKYMVQQGWIRYRQVGGIIEERLSDSPSFDVFDSFDEAKEAFDAIDLESDWRCEKMCAGRAFDGSDAYKSVEVQELDEDGYVDVVEVLCFEKYGKEPSWA